MEDKLRGPNKVLQVLGGLNRGGAETLLMNIYRNMNRNELMFDFAIQKEEKCDYEDEITSLGGKVFHHVKASKVGPIRYGAALYKTIKHNGPYLAVHCHSYFFNGLVLLVAFLAGVPTRVSHSHNTKSGRKHNVFRIIYNYVMRFLINATATHKLGCSIAACEALYGVRCWSDRRVQVFMNGIDLYPYSKLPQNKSILRTKLSLPVGNILIGHVGRFNSQKNHPFLIEVFSEYGKHHPDALFILVGDGEDRPKIEELILQKGIIDKVILLGTRSDIPELLGALDLLLLPSVYEGLPLVLLEAQAAGLPCIVADHITKEADMGMNLISYVAINEGAHRLWAEHMDGLLHEITINRGTFIETPQLLRCDILTKINELENIYYA